MLSLFQLCQCALCAQYEDTRKRRAIDILGLRHQYSYLPQLSLLRTLLDVRMRFLGVVNL